MAEEINAGEIKRVILNDVRVELKDEFDQNFERKGFFSDKWKRRANPRALGSLLNVTGTLRRSIKAEVTDKGVRFTSAVPYASIHNEGGAGTETVRSHTRTSKRGKTYNVKSHSRKVNIPRRQFIGDGADTQKIIKGALDRAAKGLDVQLTEVIKKTTR